MRVCSFVSPIISKHLAHMLAQSGPLRRRQIGLFVLGEGREQENRHIVAAKEIDHACAAPLATSAETEAQLANSAGAWDHHAAARLDRNLIDDGCPLFGGEQAF